MHRPTSPLPAVRGGRSRRLRLGLLGLAATIGTASALWTQAGGPAEALLGGTPAPSPRPEKELVGRLKAAVFPVRAYRPDPADPKRVLVEYGSGVAVGPGTFLTAAHVARPGGGTARVVVLVGDRELPAAVAPPRKGVDAAALSVPDYDGRALPRAEAAPGKGAGVFVAGFPVKFAGAALPELVVTAGNVVDAAFPSPLKEHAGAVLRVRVATDLGGSGGAVVDANGDLVGLVFGSRFVAGEATHAYAVPVTDLAPLLPRER